MPPTEYTSWGQQIVDDTQASSNYLCQNCDSKDAIIVGFVVNPPLNSSTGNIVKQFPDQTYYAIVLECQKCFATFWFHIDKRGIESRISNGTLPEEIRIDLNNYALLYDCWGEQIHDGVLRSNNWQCPKCNSDYFEENRVNQLYKIIGVTNDPPSPNNIYGAILECQKCFCKLWFHVSEDWIDRMIERKIIPKIEKTKYIQD